VPSDELGYSMGLRLNGLLEAHLGYPGAINYPHSPPGTQRLIWRTDSKNLGSNPDTSLTGHKALVSSQNALYLLPHVPVKLSSE
jgi:hypothetical protein